MFENLQKPLSLIGRVLLALLFVPAGISKIGGFAGTVGYIGSVGLPAPTLAALIAIVLKFGVCLSLLVACGTRPASLALPVFTLVASFFFHAYWGAPADQAFVQQLMFFKNIAVVGGLLMLAANGAGSWSLDNRRAA